MDIVGYARRFLALVCILFQLASLTIPSVFSATAHGCAPATPPPVAGMLAQPEASPHVLFINEVLSNPSSHWNCSEQGTSSAKNDVWVELYNPQNQALDLYTVHSSLDSGPNTTRSYFPLGTAIAAHGFLVIFPPISIFAQLSSTAGSSTLRLLMGDTMVDQVTLIALVSDTSYARMPDGGDTWHVTDIPTIDASNVLPTPTPTRTPKPIRTPKPSLAKTDSPKSSNQGKIGNSTYQGATIDTSTQPAAKQPIWNALYVPTTISLVAEPTTQGAIPTSAPQATDTGDLPGKVVLTSLAAALLLTLLWCSRFFTRAQKVSGNPTETVLHQEKDEVSEEDSPLRTHPQVMTQDDLLQD